MFDTPAGERLAEKLTFAITKKQRERLDKLPKKKYVGAPLREALDIILNKFEAQVQKT